MKGFKDFMKKRKYVAVQYDQKSQELLRKWCKKNGFDLTYKYSGARQKEEDFDFHTTIFYTNNEVYLRNENHPINSPGKVKITGIKMLGFNNDIPVFTIESEDIANLRSYYEGLGLEDQWDEYIPHISVCYDRKPVDINNIKIPDFDLYFDEVVVEDGSEDV